MTYSGGKEPQTPITSESANERHRPPNPEILDGTFAMGKTSLKKTWIDEMILSHWSQRNFGPLKKIDSAVIELNRRIQEREVHRSLNGLGMLAVFSIGLIALDLVYEQTFLTWADGIQNVGFALLHVLGPLVLVPFVLAFLSGCAFLIWVILLVFVRRHHNRPSPEISWTLVILVILEACACFAPYRFWERAIIVAKGPGPHAAQFLVWAAADGDRPTVSLLLNRGVPVDILNDTSTALNTACAGGQAEIARLLLSKGADVNRAPDCRRFLKNRGLISKSLVLVLPNLCRSRRL